MDLAIETKKLTAGNIWNTEGLIKSRKETDSEIVLCTSSKKELFFFRENGAKVLLDSFGKCHECKNIFHHTELYFAEGIDKPSWPIEFFGSGLNCKDCHKKD